MEALMVPLQPVKHDILDHFDNKPETNFRLYFLPVIIIFIYFSYVDVIWFSVFFFALPSSRSSPGFDGLTQREALQWFTFYIMAS